MLKISLSIALTISHTHMQVTNNKTHNMYVSKRSTNGRRQPQQNYFIFLWLNLYLCMKYERQIHTDTHIIVYISFHFNSIHQKMFNFHCICECIYVYVCVFSYDDCRFILNFQSLVHKHTPPLHYSNKIYFLCLYWWLLILHNTPTHWNWNEEIKQKRNNNIIIGNNNKNC